MVSIVKLSYDRVIWRAADIAQVCVIVIIFALLFFVNIISVGLKNIEENWHLYKCNPLMMPFANAVGKDGTQNFMECVETMQADLHEGTYAANRSEL